MNLQKKLAYNDYFNRIGHHLLNGSNTSSNVSLLAGGTGRLLALVLYLKATKDEKFKDGIEFYYQKAIEFLQNNESVPSPTFCDGLAGFGWISLYLQQENVLDLETEVFFEDIDNYLSSSLDRFLEEKNWDPLHGAIGIALYFLKRGKIKQVLKVIEFLENTAEVTEAEIKWSRFEPYFSKQLYDFGLAHGMSGILYFLSKCSSHESLYSRCNRLINGNLNFYLNNLQEMEKIGSHFPNFAYCEDYPNHPPALSGIGWCYGDLGILSTIHSAAVIAGNSIVEDKAIALLCRTASRTSEAESRINAQYFCHGSAGAALIYNHLYSQTRNPAFENASTFWAKRTIEYLSQSYNGLNDNELQDSILDGSAGIGIFLTTNKYKWLYKKEENLWMESVFLA